MAVICISRELASLGEETAHELALLTGYRYLDKEYVEKKLNEYGIAASEIQKYDEKKPGFWASLSRGRDDYLHFLKTVLYEEAQSGDCILVGRGGVGVFAGVPGIVAVRLTSPLPMRLERIKAFYNCDEHHAEQLLRQSDNDRDGFHRYFFNLDWTDPVNYDMVLNTGLEHPATVAQIINQFRLLTITTEIESKCGQRLRELSLGQKIVTAILFDKGIPIHFLEAVVLGDVVTLHGVANTQQAIDSAVAVAHEVPGTATVESAIQVVQEYTIMP
jgi:cytidylate kinase